MTFQAGNPLERTEAAKALTQYRDPGFSSEDTEVGSRAWTSIDNLCSSKSLKWRGQEKMTER